MSITQILLQMEKAHDIIDKVASHKSVSFINIIRPLSQYTLNIVERDVKL